MAVTASAASAHTYTVSGYGDPPGGTCSGTVCTTLREAVYHVELDDPGSTIVLQPGTYVLGTTTSPTVVGPLFIKANMTIQGAGESSTIIKQEGPGDGVIQIPIYGTNVALSNLTVTGGHPVGATGTAGTGSANGGVGGPATGGIQTNGNLTLNSVDVTGNSAAGGTGGSTNGTGTGGMGGSAIGGIEVAGSLTMNQSTVSGNTAVAGNGGAALGNGNGGAAGAGSGGILVDPYSTGLTVNDSVIDGNISRGGVGGASAGTSANSSGAGGSATGGVASFPWSYTIPGPVTVTNSTINGNLATAGPGGGGASLAATGGVGGKGEGGGIYATNGPVSVSGSTIDGNEVVAGNGGASEYVSGAGGMAPGSGLTMMYANLSMSSTTVGYNVAIGGNGGPTSTGSARTAAAGGNAFGGAAYLLGRESIVNSTISNNRTQAGAPGAAAGWVALGTPGWAFAGGVYIETPTNSLTLASDTLAANTMQTVDGGVTLGGNLEDGSAPVQISDTIFSAATGSGTTGDCWVQKGVVTDLGHNLETTGPSQCGLNAKSDLIGVNPLLTTLGYHGNGAPTMALQTGSPAISSGGQCTNPLLTGNPLLTVDERGVQRGTPCDIGAYQLT
jgi:hypothetical protein